MAATAVFPAAEVDMDNAMWEDVDNVEVENFVGARVSAV